MALQDIILLGDERLYQVADPVTMEDVPLVADWTRRLHEALMAFRARYQAGRAIAAPQIGIARRLVYMHIDHPVVFINPVLYDFSDEMMEIWDDCMCFPNLLVHLRRHRRCRIRFYDENWTLRDWLLEDDMAELLQHECDHLDGILATQRALSPVAFRWRV